MALPALSVRAMAAAMAAAVLAGCGGASHRSSSTGAAGSAPVPIRPGTAPLTVSPRSGGSRTVFTFTFTAPAASGVQGHAALSYSLSVVGPSRPGCVGVRSAPVATVLRGRRSTTVLGPAQLGGGWCAGAYAAKVAELVRPTCSAGQVCPQFIRLVAIIGPARFTVTR